MNQLDNLKQFSTIVVDSGNVDSIRKYKTENATTNPSLILNTILNNNYHALFEDSINYANKQGGDKFTRAINASDKLIVNIGTKILKNITGHVSTEIDARLSFNTDQIIQKAIKLINLYKENEINKSRILIKIAATWDGIKAAEELKKYGIQSNLTLVFSFAQAKACAEAKVYLISPFVGRIYDWYLKNNLLKKYNINTDPGVQSVKKIYYYYKQNSYNTIIMGASFRTVEQILALSGCDYLTIAPDLLEKLASNTNSVTRYLLPPSEQTLHKPIPLSKSNFLLEHNQDKMAVEKLTEGIQQFSKDQKYLEHLLIKKL